MNMDLFWDILRFVLLIIQLLSAGVTILFAVLSRKINVGTLLSKLFDWYKKAMEDGKITSQEMTECIKMIKELSDISDKQNSSTETKEENK